MHFFSTILHKLFIQLAFITNWPDLIWSLRLAGGPPLRWSCCTPAAAICQANPLQETSPVLCQPLRRGWRGRWIRRVKHWVRSLTASKPFPHLHWLPDQLACKYPRQLSFFSPRSLAETTFFISWTCWIFSGSFSGSGTPDCSQTADWNAVPFAVSRSGCRSPTGSERKQLERSPLSRRKAQEKAATATHATALAHTPPHSAADTTTKGGSCKSLWVFINNTVTIHQ